MTIWAKLILDFCVAFGVVIGASMLAGIGSILTLEAPSINMENIAKNMKIWAVVAAIGGTIDPIRIIESNLLEGYISPAVRQILRILAAFAGAHTASELVQWLCGGGNRM